MSTEATLRVGYLYPKLMNLYGDRGNILALQARAAWHGIHIQVRVLNVGETFAAHEVDLLFVGGGQDREQRLIAQDMVQVKGEAIAEAIAQNCAVLAICGGYQLLGRYYRISEDDVLPGLGVFPVYTESGATRLICNTAIRTTFTGAEKPLVGFVNHGGQTFLDSDAVPLGMLIAGEGNHLGSADEGCIVHRAYGTYLHGALLPKNPWFCDLLLQHAAEHAGIPWMPKELDDRIEYYAQKEAIALAIRRSGATTSSS